MKLRLSRAARIKLLLLACGLLTGLLLAELGLRIAGISPPVLYGPDEHCVWRLRAGARGWWTDEGRAYIQINSARLRDREHTLKKPSGTFRIAILGDSYSEALQVPMAETYWSVLAEKLAGCPMLQGRQVEVLNFGVSGYGTAQEFLTLRHHVWQYEPDLVLLAFCTGNDVRNNSKALEREDAKPYFDLRDGRLVLDDSFRQSRPYLIANSGYEKLKLKLLDASSLLRLLWHTRQNRLRNAAPGQAVAVERDPARATLREADAVSAVYHPPRDAAWEAAWAVTERLLRDMAREVRQHNAEFCVVTLSNGIQVFPEPAVRREFLETIPGADLFYTDRRIQKIGAREDFPVLNLAPPLQRLAEEQHEFLHGFSNTALGSGHWNAAGHRAAAELVAKWLCQTLGTDIRAPLGAGAQPMP